MTGRLTESDPLYVRDRLEAPEAPLSGPSGALGLQAARPRPLGRGTLEAWKARQSGIDAG